MTVESRNGQEQRVTLQKHLEDLHLLMEANDFRPLVLDIPETNNRMFIVTDVFYATSGEKSTDDKWPGGSDFYVVIVPNTFPSGQIADPEEAGEVFRCSRTEADYYLKTRGEQTTKTLAGVTINVSTKHASIPPSFFATDEDQENYVAGIVKTVREARKAQGLE